MSPHHVHQNPPKFACKDQSVALYGQLTFSLTRISLPVCLEITFWHQDIKGWAGQAHLVMLSPQNVLCDVFTTVVLDKIEA